MAERSFRDEFVLRVPASTSNLGPGFDSFGLALPLYLSIKARRLPAGDDKFSFAGEVPAPADLAAADNLFVRAYRRGLAAFAGGEKPAPYSFEVHNAIPLQRGLGSSGACVVGALLAAALAGGKPLPADEQLLKLARELEGHGDNATPSLLGGFTISLATAAGDFFCRHYPVLPALQVLVVIPSLCLATAAARRVLPATVPLEAARENIARAALLVTALLLGDLTVLRAAVGDRLHQPYREMLLPFFAPLAALSYEHGSLGTFISGSGSAFVCLVEKDGRQLGELLCRSLRREFGLEATYRLLPPDNDGTWLRTPAGGEIPWREVRSWLAG